ncbi:hypothetical protein QYF61_021480 [Mycteria americana]|uniref:Proto-oncogene vav n=1 Tax=Mycteria americana TaxID=33587 RepID=A0AAN7MKL7_MYCAM|nr:hypothetical protein QYF61_021480 [Mycteria americana]
MEAWRQCARWLVAARVLPAGHRASSPEGQVWDLAQALRDGVLLCHLLNALLPRAVPPRDICPLDKGVDNGDDGGDSDNDGGDSDGDDDDVGDDGGDYDGANGRDVDGDSDRGGVTMTMTTTMMVMMMVLVPVGTIVTATMMVLVTVTIMMMVMVPMGVTATVLVMMMMGVTVPMAVLVTEVMEVPVSIVVPMGVTATVLVMLMMEVTVLMTVLVTEFLCLRNIRTFLTACADKFGLPKHRLFGAFDLFDVQDFGKVIDTLSTLSWTPIAQSKGFTPFPTEDCVGDDDIYSGLSDLIDDTAEEDDDLYDCVEAEGDDGDEIYEDLMRVEPPPAMKVEVDRRLCCIQELRQTEERYTETLESICQHFLRPLRHFLQPQDLESIFINIEELLQLHRLFLGELRGALGGSGGSRGLPPLFLAYKERFLLYGRYCSQVEAAARRLDQLATNTDLRMKLQECSQRANNGRFSLRDLLMVPMQRVLKYHLLLQELVKLTPEPAERERLRVALDAMRDLAQCVNEVKRDNETLKQLTSVQLCLHNMSQSLAQFGRPKIDGELKVSSTERRSKVDRYGFLLDKALIICKRRGDSYEAKDVVDLQSHQLRDGGLGPRDGKKVSRSLVVPSIQVWWAQVSRLLVDLLKPGGPTCLVPSGPRCPLPNELRCPGPNEPRRPRLVDPSILVLGGHKCPGLVDPSIQVLGGPKSPGLVDPSIQVLGGPKSPALVDPGIQVPGGHKCPVVVDPSIQVLGVPKSPALVDPSIQVLGGPKSPALVDPGIQVPGGHKCPVVVDPSIQVLGVPKSPALVDPSIQVLGGPKSPALVDPGIQVPGGHKCPVVVDPSIQWTHTFLLIDTAGLQGYELFFKTRELKKKWLEQFEMALSNIFPEHALADGHDFQMFSFEDTTSCRACQMLLRGTFYQGYRCSRCRAPAHKECLGRLGTCGRGGTDSGSGTRKNKSQRPGPEKKRGDLGEDNVEGLDVWVRMFGGGRGGLPKMEASQPYSGVPPPPGALGPALRLSPGDVVEVTVAEAEQLWWQGRNVANGDLGWFPCAAVRPFICVPLPDLSVYPWYAGPMERGEAEQLLMPRSDGAFLVRQRVKDAGEFAISIKYRGEVKHIKVMTADGLYRVTEKKVFKGLVELVEFYQHSSLKDCFKALDTALVVPFKEPESRASPRPPGAVRSFGSAKARYDFCARDRTELTLREGDIIRVLSKKGHTGWWKGEIYGRVGWFPANYVEEDYSEYC